VNLTQHCISPACEFTHSHTAGWCGTEQPWMCACAYCYPMSDRLWSRMRDFDRILRDARMVHLDGTALVATCALFSGGKDSTLLLHLMRGRVDLALHADTTIGANQTRQFVDDTAKAFGIELRVQRPPMTYAEHVLEHGFPGPAQHYRMYQRLKERALRTLRAELVTNGYRQRVLFVAGRRRAESARRSNVVEHERVDSVIWASPLANWTAEDMTEYREWAAAGGDPVPVNPLAAAAGMSMECCCGAFAEPGEFDDISRLAPDVATQITALEDQLRFTPLMLTHPYRCQWGWGAYRAEPDSQPPKTGALCSSCDARREIVRPA
jgi:3'-phosphoadenosine 5'-phosphosulfate sulfotransferase (PAPS reductase)/FAD synthetase